MTEPQFDKLATRHDKVICLADWQASEVIGYLLLVESWSMSRKGSKKWFLWSLVFILMVPVLVTKEFYFISKLCSFPFICYSYHLQNRSRKILVYVLLYLYCIQLNYCTGGGGGGHACKPELSSRPPLSFRSMVRVWPNLLPMRTRFNLLTLME